MNFPAKRELMKPETVTLWDRMTYHNRFTDVLMRISGMKNWRRDKRQMIPFAVSVKSSLYLGILAGILSALLLAILLMLAGVAAPLGLLATSGGLSLVLTFILQFFSNCGWNARAMNLNNKSGGKPSRRHESVELLGDLPEILR